MDDYSKYRNMPVDTIIDQPGKFEGEPRYVPELWDMVLDGEGEDCHDEPGRPMVTAIPVDAALIATYPELQHHERVELWESDNGFVFSDVIA